MLIINIRIYQEMSRLRITFIVYFSRFLERKLSKGKIDLFFLHSMHVLIFDYLSTYLATLNANENQFSS